MKDTTYYGTHTGTHELLELNAKTLIGAKREISKFMSSYGTVQVCDSEGYPYCSKIASGKWVNTPN